MNYRIRTPDELRADPDWMGWNAIFLARPERRRHEPTTPCIGEPANTRRLWTGHDDEDLIDRLRKGQTSVQIAEAMGRTPNAIASRSCLPWVREAVRGKG